MQQNKIRDEYGSGWHWKRLRCEGFGRSILRIFIIYIPKNRLQSTCVAFMAFEISRTEVEGRVAKLENGKGKVSGDMIKRGTDWVVYWIWML